MVHRNAELLKKTKEVGGKIDEENKISVVFFDGLEGLDKDVVEILNQKIKSVRA